MHSITSSSSMLNWFKSALNCDLKIICLKSCEPWELEIKQKQFIRAFSHFLSRTQWLGFTVAFLSSNWSNLIQIVTLKFKLLFIIHSASHKEVKCWFSLIIVANDWSSIMAILSNILDYQFVSNAEHFNCCKFWCFELSASSLIGSVCMWFELPENLKIFQLSFLKLFNLVCMSKLHWRE